MNPTQSKWRNLTREELYDRVWQTPGSKLSEELGVSDVAIAKQCKKMAVPRPPRGYWAKIEAGRKVPMRKPLPPDPADVASKALRAPVPKRLVASGTNGLHPVAAELLKAIGTTKADEEQRVRLDEPTLPKATVSKAQGQKVAEAFDGIVKALESREIRFRKARSKYDPGYFEKGRDRIYLEIEEPVVSVTREPTAAEKRRPNWYARRDIREPSGKLTFTIKPERYTRSERKWTESEKEPLDVILAKVIEGICQHYIDLERKRAEEAEATRKRNEAYEIQRAADEKREHAKRLEKAAQTREEDLIKAAEWWRMYWVTCEFIDEAERRWREASPEGLTSEQDEWLAWAREKSQGMCPFASGYPDPAVDGTFDPSAVTFGGPYPATRSFPRPPTMPEIPVQTSQSSYGYSSPAAAPKPYPFWLKHQR